MKFIKSTYFKYGLFVIAILGFFTVMQFVPSKGFADPDGYYHAGAARLMAQGKLEASFPWAYFSTLRDYYADVYIIYHLLLIPLSSIAGMHISVVLFSSAMVFVFAWLLKRFGVKYAPLWGVFLVVSSVDFLFRINVLKANTLSLILMFMAAWLLSSKKYYWLVALSALYVWVYGGFVFLPAMAGIYMFSYFIVHRKINIRPILAVFAGITIGVILHPHFPNILILLYYELFHTGLAAGLQIPVGGEWYPYSFTALISANGLAVLAYFMTTAVFIVEFHKIKEDKDQGTLAMFLWLYPLLLLLLTIRSRRFVEVSVPFMIVFVAYASNKIASPIFVEQLKQAWRYWHMKFFTVLIIWILILVGAFNVTRVYGWLSNSVAADALKGSGQWLSSNTKPGEIIFNTNWDDLPQLFYWNPNNYYIIGYDPTYLYTYDHALYWKWRQVADNDPSKFGNSYATMRDIVHKDFLSRYIVLENARSSKLKIFLDAHVSEGAKKVYEDEFASIYQIN